MSVTRILVLISGNANSTPIVYNVPLMYPEYAPRPAIIKNGDIIL